MQTHKLIRPLIVAVGLVGFSRVLGQVSVPGHAGGPGDHLGWDNTNAFPLEVRHDGNQPVSFFTTAIQRMKLFPNVSPVINGYPALPRNGSLVLSNLDAGFVPARVPFSRLHLIDVGGIPTPMS